jgi:hypothetical protein
MSGTSGAPASAWATPGATRFWWRKCGSTETKTWIEGMTGGPFDPDAFDLDAVNRALKALRAK